MNIKNTKTLRYFALVAITALTALFFTACGDDDPVNTGSEKDANIVSFTFTGIVGNATINSTERTVTATAGSTVNLTNLAPTFTLSTNATAKVGTVAQTSGVTQNDFTNPVVYAITSGDGSNTQNWTVTITQGDVVITDLTSEMINKADATLAPGIYLCKTSLTLNSGNTLTISPGVTIRFEAGRMITAENNATIRAKGTAAAPITFTSSRSDKQPGDWYGIRIAQDGSEFEYCTFEYGSGTDVWHSSGMLHLGECKVSVKNCTFRHAKYSGIYLYGTSSPSSSGFSAFDNNTITNCGETQDGAYPIKTDGYAGLANLAGIGSGNTITTAKGIAVNGRDVANSMTLKAFVPYIFTASAHLDATLTIEPGAVLKFDGNNIEVRESGKLIAKGTASTKITFTSAKASPKAGDWHGINILNSDNSEFEYCTFEYGSGSDSWSNTGLLRLANCKASVKNCSFSNAKYSGIYLYDGESGFEAFENNTMTNCGETQDDCYPIKTDGYAGLANLAGIGSGNTITTTKGIGVNGGTVGKSMLLKRFPYIVYGDIHVTSSSNAATLTIESGAKLMFAKGHFIEVTDGGKLIAQGTSDKITFTGTVEQKGYWRGIEFRSGALDGSILENCDISYGGGGNTWSSDGNITCQGTSEDQVTIKNCNITNSKGYGIFFVDENSKATMSGNTFSGNTKGDTGTGE